MPKLKKQEIQVQTRYGKYRCLCLPDPDDNDYIVTIPSLTGVVTWGKNLQQVKKMAREAIELHLECLVARQLSQTKTAQRKRVFV